MGSLCCLQQQCYRLGPSRCSESGQPVCPSPPPGALASASPLDTGGDSSVSPQLGGGPEFDHNRRTDAGVLRPMTAQTGGLGSHFPRRGGWLTANVGGTECVLVQWTRVVSGHPATAKGSTLCPVRTVDRRPGLARGRAARRGCKARRVSRLAGAGLIAAHTDVRKNAVSCQLPGHSPDHFSNSRAPWRSITVFTTEKIAPWTAAATRISLNE